MKGESCVIPILFFIHICTVHGQHVEEWSREDFLKREHTLMKPYYGSTGSAVPLWDFVGSTMVTSNFVRLTPDRQSQRGGLWNTAPCMSSAWEVQLELRVHGVGTELYGDGFAFWYTKDRMQLGPVFGGIDKFSGLGVFFDTYSNHNGPHNHGHPYISAMINNGTLSYDHDSDGTHTEVSGCESKFRGADIHPVIAIRYQPDELIVSVDLNNKRTWKECFRVQGVHLPTGLYFGATSATGELSDNHEILSIKVYELAAAKNYNAIERRSIIPTADSFAAEREHVPDPGVGVGRYAWKGLKLFLIIFFSIVGLLAVVIGGIYFYRKHMENSRKRFY